MSHAKKPSMRIALVGQPNCGKSTIFNHLVGYKAKTSNLPGTTVEYLISEAMIDGQRVEVVDLPGTYSLTSLDEAEAEARNYLLEAQVDAVLNVVDASLLSRSLELTLQLLELRVPVVLCLNMIDEAKRKGIEIDEEALSAALGIPVVGAVAVRGIGVKKSASEVIRAGVAGKKPEIVSYGADLERVLRALTDEIRARATDGIASRPRLLAIKLLEEDPYFREHAEAAHPELLSAAEAHAKDLEMQRGRQAAAVMSAERHARAMELFEQVSSVGRPIRTLRDQADRVLMHPALGVVALGAILYALFLAVFKVGGLVEGPLVGSFDSLIAWIGTKLPETGIAYYAVQGLVQGVAGAIGIVFPYLLPFLIGLSLLEDIGYLPRAGYLIDGLMHRIGLHGKSVIPFILGYGCSVPAVMATRILDSRRDRFVTAMLATMVPCVARTTIIYGLVGYFLGPHLAFLLYVINVVVIAITGKILTRVLPRVTPGLILEIPSYKVPSAHVIGAKVWLRVHDFLRHALPILVIGSIIMSLLEFASWDHALNLIALPFTWSLGLPLALGIPLIFGIFRKELSLVMLFQALGTAQVASVLTAGQMMTFTLFVLFYVPCIATIAVLRRELGTPQTAAVVASTTGIALVVGLLARGAFALLA